MIDPKDNKYNLLDKLNQFINNFFNSKILHFIIHILLFIIAFGFILSLSGICESEGFGNVTSCFLGSGKYIDRLLIFIASISNIFGLLSLFTLFIPVVIYIILLIFLTKNEYKYFFDKDKKSITNIFLMIIDTLSIIFSLLSLFILALKP